MDSLCSRLGVFCRNRFLALVIIAAAGLITALGGLSVFLTARAVFRRAASNHAQTVGDYAAHLEVELSNFGEDARFLNRLIATDQRGGSFKEPAARYFLGRLRTSKRYMQARFLDQRGREVIRVDRDGERVRRVPDSELQDKSDHYYFTEAMKLPAGDLYVSPLDLNREHGKIEVPHRPTIRVAAPIDDPQRQRRGVLVLNAEAGPMLRLPGSNLDLSGYFLADDDGFYLQHSLDPTKAWGGPVDLDSGENIRTDFPRNWQKMIGSESGWFLGPQGRYYVFFQRASALKELGRKRFFIAAVLVPKGSLTLLARKTALLFGLGLLVLLGALGTLLVYSIRQQLHTQREKDLFFGTAVDPVCIADFDGKLIEINRAWERKLGWTREDILRKRYIELIHPEDREEAMRETAALIKGGGYVTVGLENRFQCKDGSYRWLEWNVASVPEERRLFATGHDITDRKRLEQKRREMLATVNHDLKNPLGAVSAAVELMKLTADKPLNEKGERPSDLANRNIRAMQQLIEDFLDQDRLESGDITVRKERFDLVEVVREAVVSGGLYAKRWKVKVGLDGEPAPAMVDADPKRVRQVLANLLSNAAKFSAPGAKVRVRVEDREGIAQVAVVDNGKGIPEEARGRLFKRYSQVRSEDAEKGSGLGLSICKDLAEKMGGTIRFESQPGVETTFFLELPFPA